MAIGIDSNTLFISHFNGSDGATSATDLSDYEHTINFANNAQLDTSLKKYGTAALKLDGSNDHLYIPHNNVFNFGADDFTIDAWCNFDQLASNNSWGRTICAKYTGGGNRSFIFSLANDSGVHKLRFLYDNGSSTIELKSNDAGLTTGTWHHIALVRDGSTLRFFVDGNDVGTASIATISDSTVRLDIGAYAEASSSAGHPSYFDGHIDEMRISDYAVWKSNFTPPTVEYEKGGIDSNTKLMLHMNGADGSTTFTDDSNSAHNVTAFGDAQINTTQRVFGGASAIFGGSDFLFIPNSSDWDFADGDFTIDFRVRFSSLPSVGNFVALVSSYHKGSDHKFICSVYNDSGNYKLRFYYDTTGSSVSNVTSTSITISTGNFYHFSFVRDGSNIRFFVDGVDAGVGSIGTVSLYHSSNPNYGIDIGAYSSNGDAGAFAYFNGQIDELRISKGIARWTTNFDVPTAEYTGDSVLSITNNFSQTIIIV